MIYYTYAYLREDGTPYYVGKGKGIRIHSKSNRIFNPPPKSRRIYLKQNLTEEEAFKHEIYMISILGRKDLGTGILHNKSNGGIGGGTMKGKNHSQKSKKLISDANSGRIHTKKSRENMSKSHKGLKLTKKWIENRTQSRCKNKKYIIIKDNDKWEITNLNQWCKENNIPKTNAYRILGNGKNYKGYFIKKDIIK